MGKCCRQPHKRLRKMFRSVVTVAKVTLVCLNIWVMAVVLVVSLGHWRVFDSNDPSVNYGDSHLIVMRELKEEGDRKIAAPNTNDSAFQNGVQKLEGLPAPLNPAIAPIPGAVPVGSRIENLRHWCQQQHPHKTAYGSIPPNKLSSILVDQRHKLLFCQIPGVALNDWRKIMLILTGAVNVTQTSKISGGDVFNKYGKMTKRLADFNEKERVEMLEKYHKVLFVRDPLERLVVAFRSKLVPKSSKYFHRAFGSPIIRKYRKNATAAQIKDGSSVKFSEFVRYIIDNEYEGAVALNEHWEQYYKQCHPCLVGYDFIGTFENVERDTKTVLQKIEADKILKPPYIADTKMLSKTELLKEYSAVTAKEVNKIFKVFSADYTLFGYQCPEFLHTLLQKANIFHDY